MPHDTIVYCDDEHETVDSASSAFPDDVPIVFSHMIGAAMLVFRCHSSKHMVNLENLVESRFSKYIQPMITCSSGTEKTVNLTNRQSLLKSFESKS